MVKDTARRDTLRIDTLKAPLARSEHPASRDIGAAYHWNRSELFSSGALNLLELVERVPGAIGFRAGWLLSPEVGGYLGHLGRVRVIYDGVEVEPLTPRGGGMLDLSSIPIWTLEEVTIERGADELRVHLSSWRVDRTTPYTRADIATGDINTNHYRGFFGRRYAHGEALQLGAEQVSTNDSRSGGGGDALSLLARVGWARGDWKIDGFMTLTRQTRTSTRRVETGPASAAFEGATGIQYVRAAYGTTESRAWMQLIAGRLRFTESSPHGAITTVGSGTAATISGDTIDSLTVREQSVAAAGIHFGPLHVSATDRLRRRAGRLSQTPSVRLAFDRKRLALSAFAERSGIDTVDRAEAAALLTPFSWLALSAVTGRSTDQRPAGVSTIASKGEAALRVRSVWLSGGLLQRQGAELPAPRMLDPAIPAAADAGASAVFIGLRGPVYQAISMDATALRWNDAGSYRPKYQTRSEVVLRSKWLSRFPSGDFEVLILARHEYRSGTPIPSGSAQPIEAVGYRVISSQLEIRILSAWISWQYRNIAAEHYQQIPGFEMPRATNYYGVRWDFWN